MLLCEIQHILIFRGFFLCWLIVFYFPGQGRVRAGSVSWVQAVAPCKSLVLHCLPQSKTAMSPLGHLLLISKGQVHALGKQLSVFPHPCAIK